MAFIVTAEFRAHAAALTSRPSQNSFSVICLLMTSSRCRAASSGLPSSTRIRSW